MKALSSPKIVCIYRGRVGFRDGIRITEVCVQIPIKHPCSVRLSTSLKSTRTLTMKMSTCSTFPLCKFCFHKSIIKAKPDPPFPCISSENGIYSSSDEK